MRGRNLPAMTQEQRKHYDKLQRIVGREAALAEVFGDGESQRAVVSLELRVIRSEVAKRAWADPAYRAHMLEARKRAGADPEIRARKSAAQMRAWTRPEVRAAHKRALVDSNGSIKP